MSALRCATTIHAFKWKCRWLLGFLLGVDLISHGLAWLLYAFGPRGGLRNHTSNELRSKPANMRSTTMDAPTRRTFLGLAQKAAAAAAVGAIGAHFIETAGAMPVAPDLGKVAAPPDLVTHVQWRRRRRRVCWWHRGRRRCGWRWV